MVLAGAGGVDHDELVQLACKYFGHLDNTAAGEIIEFPPARYTGSEVRKKLLCYLTFKAGVIYHNLIINFLAQNLLKSILLNYEFLFIQTRNISPKYIIYVVNLTGKSELW